MPDDKVTREEVEDFLSLFMPGVDSSFKGRLAQSCMALLDENTALRAENALLRGGLAMDSPREKWPEEQ